MELLQRNNRMAKKAHTAFPRGNNLKRCEAMIEAHITDSSSQEGINFCTDQCPYDDKCRLFED